jgi:hypothetical protein
MHLVNPHLPHRTKVFAYAFFAVVLLGSMAVWVLSMKESLGTFARSVEAGASTGGEISEGFQNAFAK